MRDFEHDLLKRPDTDLLKAPAKDATSTTSKGPVAPVRHPALDVASVMRLQRTAGNQGVIQMLAGDEERSPVHEVVGSGGGTPLDAGTRGSMESAFGTSFEDVRVHTDAQASKSAESVGANAYTVGSDVVFRSGAGCSRDRRNSGTTSTAAHWPRRCSDPVHGVPEDPLPDRLLPWLASRDAAGRAPREGGRRRARARPRLASAAGRLR